MVVLCPEEGSKRDDQPVLHSRKRDDYNGAEAGIGALEELLPLSAAHDAAKYE